MSLKIKIALLFRKKKDSPDYKGGGHMHYTARELTKMSTLYIEPDKGWTRWMIDRWNRPGTVDEYEEVLCSFIVRGWMNDS